MKKLVAVLALCSFGCAGSFETARSSGIQSRGVGASPSKDADARCQSLDDQRITWGAIAKGTGVLSGGAGLSTIPVEDRDAQIALAATSAGLVAITLVATYVSDAKGEAWARDCSQR